MARGVIAVTIFFLGSGGYAMAMESAVGPENGSIDFPVLFLFLVFMLFVSRIGALVERVKQPVVLGELFAGLFLAGLILVPGLGGLEIFRENHFIEVIAEIGVVLLLFRVGLESNIKEMARVGIAACAVAVIGVCVPFAFGLFLAGPFLFPDASFHAHLFLGATLTATSVGITARVFRDLNALSSASAKIVLGAAVIDDVLGLLILAVVSGIVSGGGGDLASVSVITGKAIGFLAGAIVLGQIFAPHLGKLFSKIHTGVGMKLALALFFCGIFSAGAHFSGLAPIVGAFAAGLVLDPVHFRGFSAPAIVDRLRALGTNKKAAALKKDIEELSEHETRMHVEELVEGLSYFFVPIFFVYTGMQVDFSALLDSSVLFAGFLITLGAICGKVVSGIAAGASANKWVVGVGMIPRGEVGLIFANIGKSLGVVNEAMFAAIILMVLLSTLITPPLLALLLRKKIPAMQ